MTGPDEPAPARRRWLPAAAVLLTVGAGGALGGAARVWAGLVVPQTGVPGWAVLVAVNVLGALAMGLVVGRGGALARPAVTTGVLGGFTSFSGWVLDVLRLLGPAPVLAVALLVAVPVATVSACMVGLLVGGRAAGRTDLGRTDAGRTDDGYADAGRRDPGSPA
ncbi:FluC/FEX family fluoride channel [Aquipuribacter hungaricus]|uniref:Fluoride-specific ion channel n=1 Tax=Aquipuribacter hungaricus TaxID=545624 RepID=A0ABV7WB92_9MICO